MLKTYNLDEKNGKIIETSAEDAHWLHLSEPQEFEIDALTRRFHFPKDYLTAVLDEDEVSRVERLTDSGYKDPALILVLYPTAREDVFKNAVYETRPLAIILTETVVITACNRTPRFLKKIINNEVPFLAREIDSEQLVLEILWRMSTDYVRALKDMNARIEGIEERVQKETSNDIYYRMISLQKSIVYLTVGIEENTPVFSDLSQISSFYSDRASRDLLRDVSVEIRQAQKMAHQSLQMINQLQNAFSNVVSNNLNQIMKVMTALTIIMTIPTIVGGFWGMNVHILGSDDPYEFAQLLVATTIACAVAAIYLRKKKYF